MDQTVEKTKKISWEKYLTKDSALIGTGVLALVGLILSIYFWRKYQNAKKRQAEIEATEKASQTLNTKALARLEKAEDLLSDALVVVKKATNLLQEEESPEKKYHTKKEASDEKGNTKHEVSEAEKDEIREKAKASLNKKPTEIVGNILANVITNSEPLVEEDNVENPEDLGSEEN